MARKLAFGLGFNCGIRPFYAACCFDVLNKGSVLCLLNASFETCETLASKRELCVYRKIDFGASSFFCFFSFVGLLYYSYVEMGYVPT